MNNRVIALQTRHAINSYDAHSVRKWAEQSRKELVKAIHANINASELLSMYPYNPDMMLDDLCGLTFPEKDDTKYLSRLYLGTYRRIERLEWDNVKRFDKGDDQNE